MFNENFLTKRIVTICCNVKYLFDCNSMQRGYIMYIYIFFSSKKKKFTTQNDYKNYDNDMLLTS